MRTERLHKGKAKTKGKHRKSGSNKRTPFIIGSIVAFVGLCLTLITVLGVFGAPPDRQAGAFDSPPPSAAPRTPSPPPTRFMPTTITLTPTPTAPPTPTPIPTPEPSPVDLEYPYYITVDKIAQIVTVYTVAQDGTYTLPVKQMICSTGEVVDKFPDGLYQTRERIRWQTMLSHGAPLYAQYCTRIAGSYLFHSIPYTSTNPGAMRWEDYNVLGSRDSGGCIRLQCKDAKWIYDNVPLSTPVEVLKGVENPELIAALKPAEVPEGTKWDPSDPDEKNPIYSPEPHATPWPTPALGVTPAPTQWKFSPDLPRITPRPSVTPVPPSSQAPSSPTQAPNPNDLLPQAPSTPNDPAPNGPGDSGSPDGPAAPTPNMDGPG